MQINSIGKNVSFGAVNMDAEAKMAFDGKCYGIKRCKSWVDYYNKVKWAEDAPVDFSITSDGNHIFQAIAKRQKTKEILWKGDSWNVHQLINDVIDQVRPLIPDPPAKPVGIFRRIINAIKRL